MKESAMRPSGWVVTASDVRFELFDATPEMVCIEDIAHALSNQCRFNGHVQDFYSVAQHSVLVSQHVPDEEALTALLHDAAEAYVGDMVRPLKRSMPAFREIEDRLWEVIRLKFGLGPITEAIRHADERALVTERRDLLLPSLHRWELVDTKVTPFEERIVAQGPIGARSSFLQRYQCLLAMDVKRISRIQEARHG